MLRPPVEIVHARRSVTVDPALEAHTDSVSREIMSKHVYNVSEARVVDGIFDSAQLLSIIHSFLVGHSWRVLDVTPTSLRAEGLGVHVNFKPKLSATVSADISTNQTRIEIKSYATIKVATYALPRRYLSDHA